MQYYSDKDNKSGMKIVFMIAQMMVLLVVYIIVYTSFLAVGYAVEQYDVSPMMYFPVVVALVLFPILLYKYRQIFNAGKMLVAYTWMMTMASLTVVLLYVYIEQITS